MSGVQIGHNNPPPPTIAELLDPEMLTAQWEIDHPQLMKNRPLLTDAIERFNGLFGPGKPLNNDEEAKRASDFAKTLKANAAEAEAARVAVGRPFLNATTACNAFFKNAMVDPFTAAARTIERLLGAYQDAVEARLRQEREDAAKAARAEADLIATEALAKAQSPSPDIHEALEQAVAADDLAQQAEIAANAPSIDLTRIRGSHGSVASRTEVWDYEVVDKAEIPLDYLDVADQRIRAAIRGKNGIRAIKGLRIFSTSKTTVR